MALDPRLLLQARREAERPVGRDAGMRRARLQRLQIGLFGLGSMILLIAMADIIITRARLTEASVPALAGEATSAPAASTPRDPLVDAGVVPELPVQPSPAASPDPLALPRDGDAPAPVAP